MMIYGQRAERVWSAGRMPAHSGLRPPNTTNSSGDEVYGRVWDENK